MPSSQVVPGSLRSRLGQPAWNPSHTAAI